MSEPLWKADEVIAATAGKASGRAEWVATGVSIDSRTLEKGDLFVAIKGDNSDGHAYVEQALGNGAAAALVSEPVSAEGPLVVVPDTLTALQQLGAAARERAAATRFAVTGSVGKTGTKDMLSAVLSEQGTTHASVASYNNHWGVPLTLARMPSETKYGVFEMGMNHANEIRPLTKMVQPHIAIITAIEPVHIEFFDGLEGIADAKAEIFEGVEPDGAVVLNADGKLIDRLTDRAKEAGVAHIYTFGSADGVSSRLLRADPKANSTDVEADVLGTKIKFELKIPGRHIALNSLAVLTAVKVAGADPQLAAERLAQVAPREGRGLTREIVLGDGPLTLIDESYNANPASMTSAIRTLAGRKTNKARTIAVLGDMLELGDNAPTYHRELAAPLLEMKIDRVFLAGPHMKQLWNALDSQVRGSYAEKAGDLVEPLAAELGAGDIVMVKGSLGTGMKVVVDGVIALDQRESR